MGVPVALVIGCLAKSSGHGSRTPSHLAYKLFAFPWGRAVWVAISPGTFRAAERGGVEEYTAPGHPRGAAYNTAGTLYLPSL